jgi:predicted nucleic acid-binding protein
MIAPTDRVVVVDANALINLAHVERVGLLSTIPNHDFVVPEDVREEVLLPQQRAVLDAAVDSGGLLVVALRDVGAIAMYADLVSRLGRGEAACIAIAAKACWFIASDEKGRFLREVEARVGLARGITTVDLFVLAIKAGLLTIEEADADLISLEGRRFRVWFRSYEEIVGQSCPRTK